MQELLNVLPTVNAFTFKELFVLVYKELKARGSTSGGEEMLRLRVYEKLQQLVSYGLITKAGQNYKVHEDRLKLYIDALMAKE